MFQLGDLLALGVHGQPCRAKQIGRDPAHIRDRAAAVHQIDAVVDTKAAEPFGPGQFPRQTHLQQPQRRLPKRQIAPQLPFVRDHVGFHHQRGDHMGVSVSIFAKDGVDILDDRRAAADKLDLTATTAALLQRVQHQRLLDHIKDTTGGFFAIIRGNRAGHRVAKHTCAPQVAEWAIEQHIGPADVRRNRQRVANSFQSRRIGVAQLTAILNKRFHAAILARRAPRCARICPPIIPKKGQDKQAVNLHDKNALYAPATRPQIKAQTGFGAFGFYQMTVAMFASAICGSAVSNGAPRRRAKPEMMRSCISITAASRSKSRTSAAAKGTNRIYGVSA